MTEKKFNVENLMIKATKQAGSATTQAVASYVMFLNKNGDVKSLREVLKKSGVYNESNRGAVNKNIKTAQSIVDNIKLPDYDVTTEGFKILCKFIEENHLTYANLKEKSTKKTETEKKQAKIESIIKQIQSLDDESFEVLQINLEELGVILSNKIDKKAA